MKDPAKALAARRELPRHARAQGDPSGRPRGPETGRKSLFREPPLHAPDRRGRATRGERGPARFLTRWVTRTRFTVRYHWTEGTIAVWDNRCTQHHVLNDFEGDV
ncbi:MAG: TauD/TfdA family dioxygenase [Myxococcota bacterium]